MVLPLTKLDVLDSFKEIKICVGYKIKGKKIDYFPLSESDQKKLYQFMKYIRDGLKKLKERNLGQIYQRLQ